MPRGLLKLEYESDDGGLNILSLSSAREIKNLDVLVEAFSRVRAQDGELEDCYSRAMEPSAERIVRLVGEEGIETASAFSRER